MSDEYGAEPEPAYDTVTDPKSHTDIESPDGDPAHAPIEGEYQEPARNMLVTKGVAQTRDEAGTMTPPPGSDLPVFTARSGSTKYVATCSCGVRFDMDSEDANRILTDPAAYDQLQNIHQAMLAHEADARKIEYEGRALPPMHPAHTPRYWITIPSTPPPGYDEYQASRPQKPVLGDEKVNESDEDPALVAAHT